jgi:hypothetical protein
MLRCSLTNSMSGHDRLASASAMTIGLYQPNSLRRFEKAIFSGDGGTAKDPVVQVRINALQAARYHAAGQSHGRAAKEYGDSESKLGLSQHFTALPASHKDAPTQMNAT